LVAKLDLYIGSSNLGKKKEILELAQEYLNHNFELKDFPFVSAEETGKTFVENAKIKGESCLKQLKDSHKTNFILICDDSGLSVDCLDGAPGIYSARYSQQNENLDNIDYLIQEIKKTGVQPPLTKAHYNCALYFYAKGLSSTYEGKCHGHIIFERSGQAGFGYDPIFVDPPSNKSYAFLDSEYKNKISHRRQAFEKLKNERLANSAAM